MELAANGMTHTLFFRPKYHIRREVHRRVEQFNLLQDSCATMHVRRGDSGEAYSMSMSDISSMSMSHRSTVSMSH